MHLIGLSTPWSTWHKKIKALFEFDPEINVGDLSHVKNGDLDYMFDIEVKNHEKYVALDRVLPTVKEFGNVTVGINMYDEENNIYDVGAELYRKIFKGNPIVKDIKDAVDATDTHHVFVRFVPEVIQFFNDDLGDYNGNWSGLAAEIAKEVFENDYRGVFFCTADKHENN